MFADVINKQAFEFTCRSEEVAQNVQQEITYYTADRINNIVSSVLAENNLQDVQIKIDKIEIDLGDVSYNDFGNVDMLDKFRNILFEKINNVFENFNNNSLHDKTKSAETKDEVEFEIFKSFMLTGNIPWWADKNEYINFDSIIKKLTKSRPYFLKQFLQEHSKQLPVLMRLYKECKPSTISALNESMPDVIIPSLSKNFFQKEKYDVHPHSFSAEQLIKLKAILKRQTHTSTDKIEHGLLRKLLKLNDLKKIKSLLLNTTSLNNKILAERISAIPDDTSLLKAKQPLRMLLRKLSVFQIEFLLFQLSFFFDAELSNSDYSFEDKIFLEDNETKETDKIETDMILQQKSAEKSFNINSATTIIPSNNLNFTDDVTKNTESNVDFQKEADEQIFFSDQRNAKKIIDESDVAKANDSTANFQKVADEQIFFSDQQDAEKFIGNKSDSTITNKKNDFHKEDRKENEEKQLSTSKNDESSFENADLKIPDKKDTLIGKDDIHLQFSPDSKKVENILRESENEQTNVTVTKLHSDQQKRSFLFDVDINKSNTVTNTDFIGKTNDAIQEVRKGESINAQFPGIRKDSEASESTGPKADKKIEFIIKKLKTSDTFFIQYLKQLTKEDLHDLYERFKQHISHKVEHKKLVNEILEHPYFLRFNLLKIYANLSFENVSENIAATASDKKITIKKEKIVRALSKKIQSSQSMFFSIIKKLSAEELIILEDIFQKRKFETEDEKKITRKLLFKLSNESIHFLKFLTDLPEEEMKHFLSFSFKKTIETEIKADVFFTHQQPEKIYIENAGLCVIAIYLSGFFSRLGYLENRSFKTKAIAARALYVLQYIVTGKNKSPEYLLQFNKLLCGFQVEDYINASVRLTKREALEATNLIQSVIENWKALKNTSVQGFRESFLQRKGILFETEQHWTLQVERKGFDLLLNTIPWGFSTIKLAWMKKYIQVEW